MESRMEKYYREDNSNLKRSSKNASLYRKIYQDYDNLDNLPIPDNTGEIDMPELQKMVRSIQNPEVKTRETKYSQIEEIKPPEKQASATKFHDINKLLEYAKQENNKLKESNSQNNSNDNDITANYKMLSALENNNLAKPESEELKKSIPENQTNPEELKYQTKKISLNPNIDQIITPENNLSSTSSLSLDILSDLKPNGNTGVTKPISNSQTPNFLEPPADDNGLDIIKQGIEHSDNNNKDEAFYTDIYKFSKKDFEDDFYELNNKDHYILKVILLIIFIILCGLAIFYFIYNYGLNGQF